jgi:hypothetical protein
MRLHVDNRREFQRIELREPIAGRLDDNAASIVDLGVLGARVELAAPVVENSNATLHFKVGDRDFAFECTVARLPDPMAMSNAPHQAGLLFLNALNDSDDALRDLLAGIVTDEIERIRPRPAAAETAATFDPETTAMRIPAPFITYRFEGGSWQRRGAFIPSQPPNGFTVPVDEDPNEMQNLCASYQSGTHEARHLIRLFAELRICRILGAPPKG